ncbi:hypothetical protein [Sphingomonas bisphenolicum]|uniref:DUF3168 domain-containing protein n=1 Tax=Sphingomonas bisphenolicum TaxID=296544 RepID=A0ABN5WD64_9SPHN|nr:hypothetical protein [Sphingomonas bisphenolicum]BBF70191.1 hypothetical protein SBA_ch1_23910 [Sphingomonas bisphenolicum]
MSFEEALLARVVGSPIGAMLGHWQGTRTAHWGDRPEGAPLPAIVFTMIDPGVDYTHGGRDPLRIAQIQADSLAQDYATAKAIADRLGRLLESAGDVAGITFTHGFIEFERDIPVVGVRGAPSVYGRTQRFSIHHKE